jgi:hypothetical protein
LPRGPCLLALARWFSLPTMPTISSQLLPRSSGVPLHGLQTADDRTLRHNLSQVSPTIDEMVLCIHLLQGSTEVTPRQLARELDIKWDTAQRMKRTLTKAMRDEEGNLRLDGLIRFEAQRETVRG